MEGHNYIIKSKLITLAPFQKKNITKNFIDCMNAKEINKFLVTKRFSKLNCLKYYLERKKKGDLYYSIYNNIKKKFIGTISLQFKKKKAYVGNVIYLKKEHGTIASKNSFNIFLGFVFKKFKINKIYAGTNPNNHSSNFNLLINNFKIIKKNSNEFKYLLHRKNYTCFVKYKVI